MIGFHFYRYILPSLLVDDSIVESCLWFDERGERKLKKGNLGRKACVWLMLIEKN